MKNLKVVLPFVAKEPFIAFLEERYGYKKAEDFTISSNGKVSTFRVQLQDGISSSTFKEDLFVWSLDTMKIVSDLAVKKANGKVEKKMHEKEQEKIFLTNKIQGLGMLLKDRERLLKQSELTLEELSARVQILEREMENHEERTKKEKEVIKEVERLSESWVGKKGKVLKNILSEYKNQ